MNRKQRRQYADHYRLAVEPLVRLGETTWEQRNIFADVMVNGKSVAYWAYNQGLITAECARANGCAVGGKGKRGANH